MLLQTGPRPDIGGPTVSNKVTATRTELQQCIDHLNACIDTVRRILERPDPRPVETDDKGWPRLGWESHDDPEAGR